MTRVVFSYASMVGKSSLKDLVHKYAAVGRSHEEIRGFQFTVNLEGPEEGSGDDQSSCNQPGLYDNLQVFVVLKSVPSALKMQQAQKGALTLPLRQEK